MSRTFKDRKNKNRFINWSKETLKTQTNRLMRRFKGDMDSGGDYKKRFDDRWNYD